MNSRPCSRSLPLFLLAGVVAHLGFTPAARADEVRLHDGRVLVGKVVKQGRTLEVETRDGVVIVTENQVASIRDNDSLRRELAEMARGAAGRFAFLKLAEQARAYGLEPEMWRHLDRAITKDDAAVTPALGRQIADFLAKLEPELLPRQFRSRPTKLRVSKLLEGLRPDTGPGRTAAIEELLAREPNADADLRAEARRNPTPRRRVAVLSALQRRELTGNDRFVLRTAVLDGNPDVRKAAVEIARPTVDGEDIAYMASGLRHANAKVRERTADALGELGHADAVKLLVLAGPHAATGLAAPGDGGGATRGHVAFLTQQAYIRDYDVEVAQAAFIADPKIDVIQSGSVLDVTVAGVVEERIIVRSYRQALKKLTQHDPGANPNAWAAWLANLPSAPPAGSPPPPTTGRR